MKVTFIIKNMTEAFYFGNGKSIQGLLNQNDEGKLQQLLREAKGDLKHNITMKIGRGSFGEQVDLNRILRGQHTSAFKLEPRRGYKLATFEVAAA